MTDNKIDTHTYYRLTKNSIWVMISNLSMVFILILTMLASRILGDDVFGEYVFLLAVSTVLADISVLGMTDYAAILVARERDRTDLIVANALGLRIPFIILFILVSELVAWFSMPEGLLAGLFIALDWAIRTVIHLMRGVLRSMDAFARDARAATVERLAVLFCAAGALFIGHDLVSFAVGFFVGRLIGLFACFLTYVRLGERLHIAFDRAEWKRLFRGGIPIGTRGILKGVSFRIDAIMLGFFRPLAEVGWYGAAYKLLEASFFFQESVSSSLQPAISRAYGLGDKGLISDFYGRAYKFLLILGGFLAVIGFLHADSIINLIFGEEFSSAGNALSILVWAMMFFFVSTVSCTLLDSVESGVKTVLPYAIAATVNITLNLILIPRIGFMGAAWSTLVTELFLATALLKISLSRGYRIPARWVLGPVAGCLAFTLVGWSIGGPAWLGSILGFIAFILLILSLGVFDRIDTQYARFLLGKVQDLGKVAPLTGSGGEGGKGQG